MTPQLEAQARDLLTKIAPYNRQILSMASTYGMDADLIRAVIWTESSGNPNAIGDNGQSFGLMQVGFAAAQDVGYRSIASGDLLDPDKNIEIGTAYLYILREHYGLSLSEVLAAYNWGIGNVLQAKKKGKAFPTVVQNYVATVIMYTDALRAVRA